MEAILLIVALSIAVCTYGLLGLRREISNISKTLQKMEVNRSSPLQNMDGNIMIDETPHCQIFKNEQLKGEFIQMALSLKAQADAITRLINDAQIFLMDENNPDNLRNVFNNVNNISAKISEMSENQLRFSYELRKSNEISRDIQENLREIAYYGKFPPARRIRR